MCEGLVALLMDRVDYDKYMMRSVARDLLSSLVFRPMMQHMTPYNINKVCIQRHLPHMGSVRLRSTCRLHHRKAGLGTGQQSVC